MRRTRLLLVGAPDPEMVPLSRALGIDTLTKRVENVLVYALGQKKMANNPRYTAAGLAHIAIFAAFQILLLNTVLLWGRAYDESFDFFGLLAEDNIVGQLYSFAKEIIVFFTILGCGVYFFYYRVIRHEEAHDALPGRGPLHPVHHLVDDGGGSTSTSVVGFAARQGTHFVWWWSPIGSLLGSALAPSSARRAVARSSSSASGGTRPGCCCS